MTPQPSTPDDEKKVTPPAATEAGDSRPEESTAAARPEETAPPAKPKRRWGALCLDAALILLLVAVLAAAGYYFRLTANRYHVPTPMELLLAESEELDRRYNELLPKANHADTQLHLRARLAQLEGQLARLSALKAEINASIDDQHGQVLAMQYAIRQADETNRSIARSLLPGMPVGNVTTTTGKAYRNATIYRLDKRYIYLRFPEGQVRFPIRHLVKDNLPELARYAFGVHELVDMSDFEQTGDATAPVQASPTPVSRPATTPPQETSYDPAPGTPVLDTEANRTTTSRVTEEDNSEQEVWDAPSGELPM